MATQWLCVQLATAQHLAAPLNNQPADILVLVADGSTGQAIVGLTKKNFAVIQHFSVPGASSGFSGVFAVKDVGTGAYQLRVRPKTGPWVRGDYLVEVTVSTPSRRGQAAGSVAIR
jgi:hypothetical protein